MYTFWSVVYGEQPSASKWNILGTNDDGFYSGSNLAFTANNVVPANALSTNAILLGIAQITTDQSTSSLTAIQVPGLSTTLTIPAGGRSVKLTAFMANPYNTTDSNGCEISIWDGTVTSGTELSIGVIEKTSPVAANTLIAMAIVTPAAGLKTYNVGFRSIIGGTMHTQSNALNPSFLLVEMI